MTKPALGFPLEGLKVLDMSRVLAGPFAGRMLCDLGADVVKVEPPEGDSTRLWGRMAGGISSYFNMANAGKRCISIDLRAAGARELVIELAAKADVVLENFRPDVMPRLGIGYEQLAAKNPRLIMLSISGFGRDGPESRRPAYAPIVHAELGLIHRVQAREGVKVDLPLSVADTNAGLHGLVALLSAVIMRDRTGLGQHIDLSMMDATLVSDDQLHFEIEHAEGTRNLPPDIWETGVGGILVSVDFRYLWKLLTTEFGITDPSTGDTPLEEKISLRRGAVAAFMQEPCVVGRGRAHDGQDEPRLGPRAGGQGPARTAHARQPRLHRGNRRPRRRNTPCRAIALPLLASRGRRSRPGATPRRTQCRSAGRLARPIAGDHIGALRKRHHLAHAGGTRLRPLRLLRQHHRDRLLDPPRARFRRLGFLDGAHVFLAMRERQLVERRPRAGLLQRRRQVLRHLDLARRRIELKRHFNLVAAGHARRLAMHFRQRQHELARP